MATSTCPLNPLVAPFSPASDRKSELEAAFLNLSKGDKQSCSKLADMNLFLLDKISNLENLLTQRLLTDFRVRITNLEREVGFLTQENWDLRQRLAIVDDSTKTMFLRLEGLQENDQQPLINYVAETLAKIGISCSPDDLDSVRSLGKHKPSASRPILIKFNRLAKRDAIFFNRANINGNDPQHSQNPNLLWINDEVSDLTRHNRKSVRDVANLANQIGIPDVKIHGDGLIIGNTKYKHTDLDLLPPLLTVACAKTIHLDQHIYFQSEYSPFSNFYLSPFEDASSQLFQSVEQAFQYRKALHHNSMQIAVKILAIRDPYKHKRLGNLITPDQQWRDRESNDMAELLSYKFTQNPSLTALLINTGLRHLHEASADSKWAIGSSLSSKAVRDYNWTGADLLGQTLEGVRNSILLHRLGSSPTTASSQSQPTHTQSSPHPDDDLTPMPDDEDTQSIASNPTPIPAPTTSPKSPTKSPSPPTTTPTSTNPQNLSPSPAHHPTTTARP